MVAYFVAEQFQRLKHCDRFYYETGDPYLRFTPRNLSPSFEVFLLSAQLAEIRKGSSFAKMICQNSKFAHKIQPNVFLLRNELTNAPIECEEIPGMDLSQWEQRGKNKNY
jgi:hypothetical protein